MVVATGLGPASHAQTPGVAAEPAPEGPATWFAQAVTYTETGFNVTYFWSKGAQMRAETVISGLKVVTIVSGRHYYAYDGLTGEGIAVERAAEAVSVDAPGRRPFGRELEQLRGQGAEKVRDEVLHGAPCEVWRVTDRSGRREIWVMRAAPQLPVRVDVFDRSRARDFRTEYLGWQRGLPISDAFFVPDSNATLLPMTLAEYTVATAKSGVVGPVPILYADLLHGAPSRRSTPERRMIEIELPQDVSKSALDRYLAEGWFRAGYAMARSPFVCFEGELYATVQVRSRLVGHRFGRSLRRLERRNDARFRVEIGAARCDADRERLYQACKPRFAGFVFENLSEMLEADPVMSLFDTREVAVYEGARLVAVSYFDVGDQSLASLLGLYDPALSRHSLGIYTMVLEIAYALENGLEHYYPGYVLLGTRASTTSSASATCSTAPATGAGERSRACRGRAACAIAWRGGSPPSSGSCRGVASTCAGA